MDSFKELYGNFFSPLKDKCISENNYLKDNNIWIVFKINTKGDYHDLYIKTHVLLFYLMCLKSLLAHCLDHHGLELCHYFSSPGLSWDAMLKMTRINLELISDIDMHLFIY